MLPQLSGPTLAPVTPRLRRALDDDSSRSPGLSIDDKAYDKASVHGPRSMIPLGSKLLPAVRHLLPVVEYDDDRYECLDIALGATRLPGSKVSVVVQSHEGQLTLKLICAAPCRSPLYAPRCLERYVSSLLRGISEHEDTWATATTCALVVDREIFQLPGIFDALAAMPRLTALYVNGDLDGAVTEGVQGLLKKFPRLVVWTDGRSRPPVVPAPHLAISGLKLDNSSSACVPNRLNDCDTNDPPIRCATGLTKHLWKEILCYVLLPFPVRQFICPGRGDSIPSRNGSVFSKPFTALDLEHATKMAMLSKIIYSAYLEVLAQELASDTFNGVRIASDDHARSFAEFLQRSPQIRFPSLDLMGNSTAAERAVQYVSGLTRLRASLTESGLRMISTTSYTTLQELQLAFDIPDDWFIGLPFHALQRLSLVNTKTQCQQRPRGTGRLTLLVPLLEELVVADLGIFKRLSLISTGPPRKPFTRTIAKLRSLVLSSSTPTIRKKTKKPPPVESAVVIFLRTNGRSCESLTIDAQYYREAIAACTNLVTLRLVMPENLSNDENFGQLLHHDSITTIGVLLPPARSSQGMSGNPDALKAFKASLRCFMNSLAAANFPQLKKFELPLRQWPGRSPVSMDDQMAWKKVAKRKGAILEETIALPDSPA
ncbi:hypothetical protein AURDEDRAFT_174063 [Auricularia subglabra TFB-10046 SS5]|nr:hypothetical protein AURDEDRAFT_174063 [Auricularia subglabra TFB-10046 SS5]